MIRIQGMIVVLCCVTVAAWGQAPSQQPPAIAPAAQPAAATSVSGCMTQWYGNFKVSDPATSKSTEVKSGGNDLWKLQHRVVKVQGVEDPKTSILYAQTVQDTGAACGDGAVAANNATGNSSAAAAQPATSGETPLPGGGVTQGDTAAPQPSTAQPAATPNAAPSTMPQAPVATAAPNALENKGTPAAGSPQGATIANPALPQADETNAIFTGCLTGAINNYQFKSNGKVYRLQGNTSSLPQMVNHQVELTGEDFNGKAIQVNAARDLGAGCKGK